MNITQRLSKLEQIADTNSGHTFDTEILVTFVDGRDPATGELTVSSGMIFPADYHQEVQHLTTEQVIEYKAKQL